MGSLSTPASSPSTQHNPWAERLPGLLLSLGVAAVAYVLGNLFPIVGGPVFGIALGLTVSLLWRPAAVYKPGLQFTSKQGLQVAIVCMGFGLSFGQVVQTGSESLVVMLSTLLVCLGAAWLLGRAMGISSNLTALIGAGTGICGASAIAAVAPVVEAEEREVAYAVSTIFAFNIIAVLTFPALGHLMGFTQQAFGLWAGTSINDTSSVVAAAYAYGTEAGDYATVVKLARATMIIPIVLGLSLLRSRGRGQARVRWTKLVPWFILGFLAAAAIRSTGVLPGALTGPLPTVGRFLIIMALAAVGLGADLRSIARTGWRPLALGALLWLLVAVTSIIVQNMTGLV